MIAVYRSIFVDDGPIWSGKVISVASSVASCTFNAGNRISLIYDVMVEGMVETHRLIRGVVVDK
jgi:hypothetical protein